MISSPCPLHKNILGIGAGLRIMLEVNFRERREGELRRILLLGTRVNRGVRKNGKPHTLGLRSGRGAPSSPTTAENPSWLMATISSACTTPTASRSLLGSSLPSWYARSEYPPPLFTSSTNLPTPATSTTLPMCVWSLRIFELLPED